MSITPESAGRRRPSVAVVMVTIVLFAIASATVVLVPHHHGALPVSGGRAVPGTEIRKVAPFRGVELSRGNVVTIRVGRPQSVVVRADRDLLGRVTTVVRSGTLVIGNKPGSMNSETPMSVEISTPLLSALLLTGSGTISARGIRTAMLAVEVSGSGVVEAAGRATRIGVTLSGSGDAVLGEVASRDAIVTLGGSGTIVLDVTRSLKAWVTGSGSILYAGDPAVVAASVPGDGVVVPVAE
jgi:hypothetical protein